eukprot:SAG31_NODE_3690_length_3986_cov_1.671984_5_plen_84_part_00
MLAAVSQASRTGPSATTTTIDRSCPALPRLPRLSEVICDNTFHQCRKQGRAETEPQRRLGIKALVGPACTAVMVIVRPAASCV